MRGKRATFAAIAALMIIGSYTLPAFAVEPPPPILGEPLTGRAAFIDDIDLKLKISHDGSETTVVNASDPSNTVVVRYTVQVTNSGQTPFVGATFTDNLSRALADALRPQRIVGAGSVVYDLSPFSRSTGVANVLDFYWQVANAAGKPVTGISARPMLTNAW